MYGSGNPTTSTGRAHDAGAGGQSQSCTSSRVRSTALDARVAVSATPRSATAVDAGDLMTRISSVDRPEPGRHELYGVAVRVAHVEALAAPLPPHTALDLDARRLEPRRPRGERVA